MTTFDLWPLPLGGGAWGAGTNMWHPKTLASYELLPAPLATQIPTLWKHISGGRGRGGALILDRCRAFDLFASVDAHLFLQTFRKCVTLQICNLRIQFLWFAYLLVVDLRFVDLKFKVRKYIPFLLINIAYDAFKTIVQIWINKRLLGLFLTQSCTVFFRNVQFCDLRINHENLGICNLRTDTPKKLCMI
jgi:hypothetical protein